MAKSLISTPSAGGLAPAQNSAIPDIVLRAGNNARFAWEEFFQAKIRSKHTRRAYLRSANRFMEWCEKQGLDLPQVAPADVGRFMDSLELSVASKKQVLAAIRHLFDGMVTRHAVALNPALSVRGDRYSVLEGKTPEITVKQARKLLQSIDTTDVIGLRDKSIIAVLIYTAARVGAVSKLRTQNLYDAGDQYCLHFDDKGGKSREIPVRHDLQILLFEYLHSADALLGHSDSRPLFTTAIRRTKSLSERAMTADDIGRMVKRRMKAAGLPPRLSPHSFRVTTITDLLEQGVPLEDVQNLAGHSDPRTTRLYDRRAKKITRNIVERITI
ncbi:MAG: tyrosine-type recombinase/integrase [Planctomycetales bacterium]|nr:tyrosine-type recombinase/integrase [Planctomycetales bacterium]